LAYIGNTPADKFLTLAKQSFSTSATTSYTLDSAVSSTQDIALFINNVRQSPVDAYTVSGTSLSLTSATAGTDEMYCVYLAKTVGTVSPASDSVTTAMIQSNAVNNSKMADDAIGVAELSATGTASSSTYLRGDNAWATAGGISNLNPIFSVRQDGSHNVVDNSDTKILWDAELVDSDNAFASDKFTVPSGEGGTYYLYTMAHGRVDSDSNLNIFYLSIYKNGSRIAMSEFDARANPLRKINTTCLTIQSLSASDYIEAYLKIDVDSGQPSYAGDDFQMMFGGFKIG
jgi:hypothetical protein